MERCANTEALNRYEDQMMKNELAYERELEFFNDDTEYLFLEIQTIYNRIKEIANGYEIELDDVIQEKLEEALC